MTNVHGKAFRLKAAHNDVGHLFFVFHKQESHTFQIIDTEIDQTLIKEP